MTKPTLTVVAPFDPIAQGPSPERDRVEAWRRRGQTEAFAEFVEVTPALAMVLRGGNDRNRRLKEKGPKNSVEAYAAAMSRGEWRLNGESVIISRTGRLLDGQHRLYAVVDADTPVAMLLVFGIDDDAQTTVDVGRVRTASDRLTLAGLKNTNVLGTAIRFVWCYDNEPGFRDYPSTAQEDATLAANPDLPAAIALASRLYRTFRVSRPAMTAAHCICRRVSPARADAFMEQVITGARVGGTRDPVARLRMKFQFHDNKREMLDPIEQLALYIKAFNAALQGANMGTLSWERRGAAAERFPIAGA